MSLNGVLIGAICTVVNHIDKCILIYRSCMLCLEWFHLLCMVLFQNNEDNHPMKN